MPFRSPYIDGHVHGVRMMTMLRRYRVVKSSGPPHDHGSALDSIVRLRSVSISGKSSTDTTEGTTLYLTIGLSIGIALLVAIAGVTFLVVRKRRQYRQVLASLEKYGDICARQETIFRGDLRLSSASRAESPVLTPFKAGWTALPSEDAAPHTQEGWLAAQEARPSASSLAMSMQRSMSPGRSQRVQLHGDPSLRTKEIPRALIARRSSMKVKAVDPVTKKGHSRTDESKVRRGGRDILAAPAKLPPIAQSFSVVPLPVEGLGTGASQNGNWHVTRSLSSNSLTTRSTYSKTSLNNWRSSRHGRSTSMGAPLTGPPPGPIPAVPKEAISFKNNGSRKSLTTRKTSVSISNATGASTHTNSLLSGPGVSTSARASQSLGSIVKHDRSDSGPVTYPSWQNAQIARPQPALIPFTERSSRQQKNVGSTGSSSIVDESTKSKTVGLQHDPKTLLMGAYSGFDYTISTSMGGFGRDDKPVASTTEMTGRKESYLPFRTVRSISVGAASNGSPYEHTQLTATGNTSNSRLWRQTSSETEGSSGSVESENVHWSLSISRPSAMKGSPNARKGRRQNTVRISTLTPQVFEEPMSQSANDDSARSMLEGLVEEKLPDTSAVATSMTTLFRPNGNAFAEDRIEPRVSRSSLTPSSPTLSAWVLHYKDRSGLDDQTFGSASGTTPSLNSHPSSDLVIPEFPSPAKPLDSDTYKDNAGLERPSRYVLATKGHRTGPQKSKTDIPQSSSNTTVSSTKGDKRHATWTAITIPAIKQSNEGGRESPVWNFTDSKRGSPVSQAIADLRESLYGKVNSALPYVGSPPLSPAIVSARTTMQQLAADNEKVSYPPGHKAEETSATSVTFSEPYGNAHWGSPSLSPKIQDAIVAPLDLPTIRRRAESTSTHPHGRHPFPLSPLPTTPICPPVDPNAQILLGSRDQPTRSVLKSVTALRRMSSEMDFKTNREAHKYFHIDGGPSPSMPLVQERDHDFWLDDPATSNSTAPGTNGVMLSDACDGAGHFRSSVAELQHLSAAPYTLRMMPVANFSRVQHSDVFSDRQPSLPLPRDVLPRPPSMLPSMRARPLNSMSPRQRLKYSRVNGGNATPRSLYDADGFLVSGS